MRTSNVCILVYFVWVMCTQPCLCCKRKLCHNISYFRCSLEWLGLLLICGRGVSWLLWRSKWLLFVSILLKWILKTIWLRLVSFVAVSLSLQLSLQTLLLQLLLMLEKVSIHFLNTLKPLWISWWIEGIISCSKLLFICFISLWCTWWPLHCISSSSWKLWRLNNIGFSLTQILLI